MGLFGIKKANEDSKPSNTFINQDIINAEDYSNMPNNTIVGYTNPALDIQNVDLNNYNDGSQETFVYSQVNTSDFNNQFVGMDMNNGVVLNSQDFTEFGNVPMEQGYADYNSNQMSYTDDFAVNQDVPVDNVVMTIDNNAMYNQDFNNVNYQQDMTMYTEQVPFDNSALFALPEGAVVEEEQPVEEEVVPEVVEEVKEPEPVFDPLDNGSNPIPVNPVAEGPAPDELALFDEEEEVKTNLFTVINLMIGIIVKPGTTIVENARKYKRMFNSMALVFWVSMLSFVMCLAGRIIAGCFSRTHDAISGASKISLNFSSLVDTNNYVPHLMVTFMIGIIAILVVALVYYISSFVNSKGVHIGIYFAISSLSLVPVIVGFTVLHPIVSILSSGIALLVLIFTVIYTLIILFTGINSILVFKTEDGRLIYNAVNIAIIFSIMVFIFSTLAKLNILDLTFILS